MTSVNDGPIVIRGSLAEWECEFRARLAVAEEDRELTRMRAEVVHLHGEIGRLRAELEQQQARLGVAEKVMADLKGSRGYRVLRHLGRWDSLERDIRRAMP
jgi:hypothetical protein